MVAERVLIEGFGNVNRSGDGCFCWEQTETPGGDRRVMLAGTYKSVSLICTASSTAISAIVVRFQVEVKAKADGC